eukprot:3603691-Heterocapsa_arctica.AAC.1
MNEGKEIMKFINFNKDKLYWMTTLQIIGTLAEHMMDNTKIRKPQSKLGALRTADERRYRSRKAG